MGKKIDASVQDAELMKVATATTLVYCSTEPANYAAIAALTLLTSALTPGTIAVAGGKTLTLTPGTITLSAGTGNNRKLTIPAQSAMTATASSGANGAAGTSVNCTYACVHDGTTLLMGTTVPTFSVTAGQQYTGNAINHEIASVPT